VVGNQARNRIPLLNTTCGRAPLGVRGVGWRWRRGEGVTRRRGDEVRGRLGDQESGKRGDEETR